MIVSERLRDIEEKMARAQVHVDTLQEAVLGYLNAEPKFLTGRVTIDTDGNAHPELDMPALGRHLSPILGDVVHNVRSAYDHLIGQLVEVSGETPTDQTYFPMLETSPTPNKRTGCIKLPVHKLVRGDIHDELIDVQPFTVLPETPQFHFLAVLNRLSIQDKHRSAILAAHQVQGTHKADAPTPLPITYEVGDITVNQDGTAEAHLIAVGKPDDYMDSEFTLNVAVCFIDKEWKPPLLPLAQDMVRSGREGIARFARFL